MRVALGHQAVDQEKQENHGSKFIVNSHAMIYIDPQSHVRKKANNGLH